jgi:cysteine desulfurase/selenocysteine lyase
MEHHANLVPWFQLRDEIGIDIRFLGTTDEYRLDLSRVDELFSDARVVSLTGMSNVLGTINPIKELAARAHDVGALVVLDAAQLIGHTAVSVRELGVDVACFSAHKMLGPTGIGVLWARYDILESMPPFLGGGGMIEDVSLDGFRPAGVPTRFEAGTPPIAEAAGLRAAIRYLTGLGMDNIATYERGLTSYALDRLQGDFGGRVRIIGPGTVQARGGVLSLDVKGVHPHDVAQVLDEYGVCVRPGHHCAKPLMKRFGLHATARASFGPYSSTDDVDVLSEALHAALARFA